MLRIAMLSLIFSVICGVLGFGGGGSSAWVWGQVLFPVFLVFSAVGFLGGLMAKPGGLREVRINSFNGGADVHRHNAPQSIQE